MARAWRIEQDFYTDRDKLFVEKKLFEDTQFPCPASEEGSPCMWVRPPTLINSPIFLQDASEPRDVWQGQMSCNAIPVVLDVLQTRPHLWNYVVAQDQSFDQDYSGMFLFRFWRSGKIEPVIIDDFLPFDVDNKTFMLSTLFDAPDLWCALLEKAYAKFLGGYERLKTTTMVEAMSDILGCTAQLYNISTVRARVFKILKSVFEFDNVAIGNVRLSPAAAEVLRPELVHSSYIVTSMQSEVDEDGSVQWIISLRHPWILPGIPSYEDESSDLDLNKVTNTFSITLRDFIEVFTELYIGISRYPRLFSRAASGSKSWATLAISGKWARCRSSIADSESSPFPLARILVKKPDSYGEKRLSTVVLSLMQTTSAPAPTDLMDIGLVVYGLRGEETLQRKVPMSQLALSNPLVKTDFYKTKEITLYLCLEPGQYLIAPETNERCRCRGRSRYLLTLHSIEPITLMNGSSQKYGEGFLSPVLVSISACQYVAIGQPIRVAAKVTDFPELSRYTMTVLLMLNRTSSDNPLETTIKVRMEYVEVCQGLTDKELVMWVYYHEYVKFPLQNEDFIARCSAFIHELGVEVSAHRVITVVLPKVKMAVDKNVVTGTPIMLTAMLHNTLPLSILSARFRIRCSAGNKSMWIAGSNYEIPPFATTWIICRLKAAEPCCHQVKVYFLSEAFKRTAALSVQAKDIHGQMTDMCPNIKECLLGQKQSVASERGEFHLVSCCVKHSQVEFGMTTSHIKPSWYSIDEDKASKLAEITEEHPEEIFYCNADMMRDNTPEAELPADMVKHESQTQIHI